MTHVSLVPHTPVDSGWWFFSYILVATNSWHQYMRHTFVKPTAMNMTSTNISWLLVSHHMPIHSWDTWDSFSKPVPYLCMHQHAKDYFGDLTKLDLRHGTPCHMQHAMHTWVERNHSFWLSQQWQALNQPFETKKGQLSFMTTSLVLVSSYTAN